MLSRHRAWVSISRTIFIGALPCALACASPPLPPPVSTTPPPTSTESPEPPKEVPPPEPIPKAVKKKEPTTVVVEIGAESPSPAGSDLVTIARVERERRRQAPPPAIVITNDTLVRRPGPKKTGAAAAAAPIEVSQAAPQPSADQEAQETLWRSRALDVRTRLKEARDRTEKLRRLTASMRDRFYLAPPQLGRDDSLWQEWGRLQESLAEAQKESEETESELERVLEEGVAAGAHAGWLTEGQDLLVEPENEEGSTSVQAVDPPVNPPSGEWP